MDNKITNSMVNSKDWTIRVEAAKQGYGLDKLADDETSDVRLETVRYSLDKLIYDEDIIK